MISIFIQKIWVKVRLTVIIILSITIGASYAIAIPQYLEIRKAADETWTHVQQIREQRIENKNTEVSQDGEDVSFKVNVAPTQVGDEGEAEPKNSVPSSEIEKLIKQIFGDDYKEARAIAFAESRLRPEATNTNVNGSTDCGIFQINSIHGLEDCHDPIKNIEYAKQLFDRSGWNPWVAYKTGKYLAYL